MERRIDRSCMPPKVLKAIETIYEYLPKSLLTEIRISKQDGSFCTPTSGTSPSPPPYDIRAQQSVQRNIQRNSRLAVKVFKRASRKITPKSPEEIGEALQAAKRIKALPESEEVKSYSELYIDASNAGKGNATYLWHILGMKLRNEEDPKKSIKIREAAVAKLFRELFPHVQLRTIEYDISKARRIYDVTCKLSSNQVLSIKKISAEDIRKVTKKNLSKVWKYCK
jgi:hypothetical protein